MSALKFSERWRRDNAILAAIYRAMGLPIWAIQRLFFEHCEHPDTVYQVTARLLKTGLISKHPLWGRRSLYRMGPVAIANYSWLKATDGEPLDHRRLLDTYACVTYCCGDEQIRKRALPGEVEESFAIPRDHLYARPFVIGNHSDRAPDLIQIRVAMSGDARRVVAEQQQSIREYEKHKSMRELLDSDRFHLVTFFPSVTAWQPANELMSHERANQRYVPFETIVLPDLMHIATTQKTEGIQP